ncbi:MAG: cold shock domain-containing protein [Methylocystis sp.]|uniref:cold shock domain-containing protein n=1 Tax=Methylocystis sp. TaxID=1911079 RepID=UPI003DA37A9F
MQTSPEIDFQGMEPRDDLRARIEEKIAHLEKLYGRMTACRVVARGPGAHHRTGGHYEFNIRIALPDGREVAVTRTPDPDERFQDVWFALGDAFKRADRQLEDAVREIRGDVKHHEAMPTGVVKSLSPADGFGLLESADGREIYFHRNSVGAPGFDSLKLGERVAFFEEEGAKGPQARRVKPLREGAV